MFWLSVEFVFGVGRREGWREMFVLCLVLASNCLWDPVYFTMGAKGLLDKPCYQRQ